ncbi:MotB family protein [Methylocapsa sp. S129]|uniref:MotB family protein n=1 Tax=Methylocapsa sp. S129 TaxID=1641869 RepID=UPI00131B76F0|nr:MotB family protein [Methylocapsa sp. S129]
MEDKHPEIIIIKRHSSHEEEHHGGAWKIAFADFMTAMMAFFLVLWIINATDKNTKTIIARYFNPLKLEDMAKAQKGIRLPQGDDARETKISVEDTTQKPADPAKDSGESDKKDPTAKDSSEKAKDSVDSIDSAQPKAHLSESTLAGDPYGSLDQIAGKVAPQEAAKARGSAGSETTGEPTALDLDAFVDPFKPLARGAVDSPNAARPESAQPPAPAIADTAPAPQTGPGPSPGATAAAAQPRPEPSVKEPAAAQPPAAAPSATHPAEAEHPSATTAAEATKLQSELVKELRAEIHAQPAPGIDVQATSEGILISLTDEFNFGMFAVGSSEPQAKVVRIMEKIAQSLKTRPGSIVVRGHTDARPYKGTGYDNWRLSSARAQMAYYMLVRGGLDEKRFERIEGYADRRLKTPDKPEGAENRRIEILLRKEKP